MASIRTKPITGEYYHIYNRGIEKRNVYRESIDYVRFIHDLFEFNDTQPARDFERRYQPNKNIGQDVGGWTPHILSEKEEKQKLVEIQCFCLMPNHYHLLVRQVKENGISLFMKKLGGGYTNGFNEKYDRVGALFQGKYKLKHVDRDEYLQHLICYIHCNPLKFLKGWGGLLKYRWSSHLDYLGQENFGSILEKKFLLEFFRGENGYKKFIREWMENQSKRTEFISPVVIDFD